MVKIALELQKEGRLSEEDCQHIVSVVNSVDSEAFMVILAQDLQTYRNLHELN